MEKYGIGFKEMDRKQKVAHIWTYYRYHILSTIVGCIVVGMLAKTMLFPPPENTLDILISGPLYADETQTEVMNGFKSDYNIGLSIMAMDWEIDGQMASVMYQKIPVIIGASDLEILALPQEEYEYFVRIYGAEMFQPLEEVPEFKELLEEHKDHLFTYDKAIDEKGNEIPGESHIYGIKVSSFPTVSCIKQNNEMVIGMTTKLRHKEKAQWMYKYLLGDEEALAQYQQLQADDYGILIE